MCPSDAIKATVIYPLDRQTHDNKYTLDLATTEAVSTKVPNDSICYIAQITTNVEWQCAAEKPSTQWFAIVREQGSWFGATYVCINLHGALFYTENWPPAELDFFYTVIQDNEFWVGLYNVGQLKTPWGESVDSKKVLVNADSDNGSTNGCVKAVRGQNPGFRYHSCSKPLSFICAST